MQRNSTAVTKFELHIDEEVDNDNKLYKWYEQSMVRIVYGTNSQWNERSMGRMVRGTNGLHVVRIVRGTNSQWYEKSRHRSTRAFSVAGPSLWNSLPDSLRDPDLGRQTFAEDASIFTVLIEAFSVLEMFRTIRSTNLLTYLLTYHYA